MCTFIKLNQPFRVNNLHPIEKYKTTGLKNGLLSHFKKEFQLTENIEGVAKRVDGLFANDKKANTAFISYEEHCASITDAHILSLIYEGLS